MSTSDILGHDRIPVELPSGEEVEVWNHCNVQTRHYVNSVNGHETFGPILTAGDSRDELDTYVTERLASYLNSEFDINVEDLDIEVVNIEDPEVQLL